MTILPLKVDPVLAEALAAKAEDSGSSREAWLRAIMESDPSDIRTHSSLSTMGPDNVQLYAPVAGTPYDVKARVTAKATDLSIHVRQLEIGTEELTYCGLDIPGDHLFTGPFVVPHAEMLLPESMLAGLPGTRLGDLVATGMPGLDARTIRKVTQTHDGLLAVSMGWDGPVYPTVHLHLEPVPFVDVAVDCNLLGDAALWRTMAA